MNYKSHTKITFDWWLYRTRNGSNMTSGRDLGRRGDIGLRHLTRWRRVKCFKKNLIYMSNKIWGKFHGESHREKFQEKQISQGENSTREYSSREHFTREIFIRENVIRENVTRENVTIENLTGDSTENYVPQNLPWFESDPIDSVSISDSFFRFSSSFCFASSTLVASATFAFARSS